MTDTDRKELVERITEYLTLGGLFNPEMANHEAVRDLLINCREDIVERALAVTGQAEAVRPDENFSPNSITEVMQRCSDHCNKHEKSGRAQFSVRGIRLLLAEIQELRSTARGLRDSWGKAEARLTVLQAENDRLREGLRRIAEHPDEENGAFRASIARALLQETASGEADHAE